MGKQHFHAIVWIDHREARIFHFNPVEADRMTIHPDRPQVHIHHKANSIGSGHAQEDQRYLDAVTMAVADAGAVLVVGPANAKTELIKHIHRVRPQVMNVIAGVESADHPSDAQIVAHARTYFKAADRMAPQIA